MPCQHCKRNCGLTDRGLCPTCYDKPRIRARYPLVRAHHYARDADFNGATQLPESPTDALPGSETKIAVLTERTAQERTLGHPENGASRRGEGRPDLRYSRGDQKRLGDGGAG